MNQVNITIGDVNDNAPEFDTSVVKISVAENAELGSPIYAAHAHDDDSGDNGAVVYQLLTNPDGVFKIDARQGFILLTRKLDFEIVQRYTVVIGAQDKGSPPLRSNLTLNVEVQDVNDNPPAFEKDEYRVNVPESMAVNSQFLQVNALDLDTGNNARLTYRVKEEALADLFGIFPNSGSLYLKKPLDREVRDRYTLTVLATDNGLPPGSAAVTVNLFVIDANDNDPVFVRDVYQFTVEENMEKGALVGAVSATDKDLDANAALRYTLLPANSSFQLNSVTGTPRLLFHLPSPLRIIPIRVPRRLPSPISSAQFVVVVFSVVPRRLYTSLCSRRVKKTRRGRSPFKNEIQNRETSAATFSSIE